MTRFLLLTGLVAIAVSGLQVGSAPAVGHAMVRRSQQYGAGANNGQMADASSARSGSANYGGYDSNEDLEEPGTEVSQQDLRGSSSMDSTGAQGTSTGYGATNTYGNSADSGMADYPAGAASPTTGVYGNTNSPVLVSRGSSTMSSGRVAMALGAGAVALALSLS